jgi:hypothetical protein
VEKMREVGHRPEIVLLPPSIFEKVYQAFKEWYGASPARLGDSFFVDGIKVVKHEYLPPNKGYIVDLDNAEKMLGYRPKF